jgi:MYXO-CTERM domain-containing protein
MGIDRRAMPPHSCKVKRLLLISTCVVSACASPREPITLAAAPIVNGTPDLGDPAVVQLDLGFGTCSGTLVAPHVVLTARHCLDGVPQGQIEVFFGSSEQTAGETIATLHHDFMPDADIGMVTLAKPGPTAPIAYNTANLAEHLGEPVRLVGFGVTSEDGSDSGTKRQGTTVLDHVMGDIMITGYVDESWTCYGDSGGPNFMTIGGVEVVAGVTSYGTTVCGMPEDGSVRTDTTRAWLDAYVAAHEDSVAPSVSISAPLDGAQVAPGFDVEVLADDNIAIGKLELYLDDELQVADRLAARPTAPLGAHVARVIATDQGGNTAEATIAVTIVAGCESDGDCAGGEVCVNGGCAGDVGTPCDAHADCASGDCNRDPEGERLCTVPCAASDECPDGFTCLAASAGASARCWADVPGGGGCTSTPGRGPAAPLAGLIALAALVATRRRR